MKKNALGLYFLSLSLFALFSCNTGSRKADRTLQSAENVVEQLPDSALRLLDSIPTPYELNEGQQAKYTLLYVQAKDKSYRDIKFDAEIFSAKDYYIRKNDFPNAALAAFYCGRVLQDQKRKEDAMTEFLKADEYAEKTKNKRLQGLTQSHIGELLLNDLLQTHAVEHLKSSIQYFHEAQDVKNEIISYNLIGNTFQMKHLNDSALYYYDKGLQLSEVNNDSLQKGKLLQNIGIAWREAGKYEQAEEYFRIASKYITNNEDIIKLNLNVSKTFNMKGMLDSAKIYADRSLSLLPDNNRDFFLAASIYKILSIILEKQTHLKQSLANHKEYSNQLEKIVVENKNPEILELEKKYSYERFKSENYQLKIDRQKMYLAFSTTLLILCVFTLFFYKKSADNKKIAEKKIYQLMEMSNSYNRQGESLKDLLLNHFDILKKAALLKQYVTKDDKHSHNLLKKFNEIVYRQDSLNWNMLYQDIDRLHNGLVSRLRNSYPEMTEADLQICCLTYANFTCDDIAIIMDKKPNTVQMKRSLIRKQLGIELRGNIQNFLKTQLGL